MSRYRTVARREHRQLSECGFAGGEGALAKCRCACASSARGWLERVLDQDTRHLHVDTGHIANMLVPMRRIVCWCD